MAKQKKLAHWKVRQGDVLVVAINALPADAKARIRTPRP